MVVITYDAVIDLKCALCTQWDATCAGGVKPRIREVWCAKLVGFDSDKREEVIISPLTEDIQLFDLFGAAYIHKLLIKLDIRGYTTIGRHNQVVKEVSRIVQNMVRRTSTGFLTVVIAKSETRNQDYRNMFRHLLDLVYSDVENHTFV